MGVCLHQHPVLPPALPPARVEDGDVLQRTLRLVLEVVATEVRWLPVHWVQHVEPPKRRTDDRTPTNISQKWAKIAISMMECGDRCRS
jgi:hypothetical protein